MTHFTHELNAKGLNCPLPLLHLKKILATMNAHDVVKIEVTDPAAHLDFGVFCNQVGHQILNHQKNPDEQIFYIQKK